MTVLYGSNVADSTLTTADDMASASGGAETSVLTTTSGSNTVVEVWSQGGNTLTGGTSIPAPTGQGWVYSPGVAGTYVVDNWSASLTASGVSFGAGSTFTIRFFRYSGGTYTTIGSIVTTTTLVGAKTTYTLTAAMPVTTFAATDRLYVDLWLTDPTTIGGDNPTIYVSNSSTAGVASDMQITTSFFEPPGDPVLYGSATQDSTLTTACDMGTATLGTETSKTTTSTGSNQWVEVWSQTNGGNAGFTSMQAPTGHGWLYTPGAGTFAAANWSALVALSGAWAAGTVFTLRFSKLSAGVYTTIGSVNTGALGAGTTRTVYTFVAAAMPATAFASGEQLYIDLWLNDSTTVGGDNPVVYVSSSSAAGVANDMQVSTSTFTPALAAPYVPHKTTYTGRGVDSTIVTQAALWYIGRGLSATLVTKYITRGLSSTLITPITRLALSGSLNGVGTLAETFTLATALTDTLVGVGTLTAPLSANLDMGSVTLAGVGTITGTASLSTALTITIPGVGTLTETFTLATALTDTFAGVGTLTGTFSANVPLAVTLPGVGTLTGTLSLSTALTDTLAGVGTLAETFTLATALTDTLAGVGTLTGTLSANTALSDTLAGVGTLNSTTTLATSLATTLVGTGVLNGIPSLTTALTAPLVGVGTLQASITDSTALTSTLVGTGTLAGITFLSTALGLTFPGTGTLAGNLSLQTALFLTCAGVGTLSPTLIILGGISCALSGSGHLAGTISFPGPSATATWVTRDMRATWVTRDEQTNWQTRDDKTTWKTRR